MTEVVNYFSQGISEFPRIFSKVEIMRDINYVVFLQDAVYVGVKGIL